MRASDLVGGVAKESNNCDDKPRKLPPCHTKVRFSRCALAFVHRCCSFDSQLLWNKVSIIIPIISEKCQFLEMCWHSWTTIQVKGVIPRRRRTSNSTRTVFVVGLINSLLKKFMRSECRVSKRAAWREVTGVADGSGTIQLSNTTTGSFNGCQFIALFRPWSWPHLPVQDSLFRSMGWTMNRSHCNHTKLSRWGRNPRSCLAFSNRTKWC